MLITKYLTLAERYEKRNTMPTKEWELLKWGSAHYRNHVDDWIKVHDFIEGETQVKRKGPLYLPPVGPVMHSELGQGDVFSVSRGAGQYNTFLEAAPFMPFTRATKDSCSGMLFRNKTEIEGLDVYPGLKALEDNIDGSFRSIQEMIVDSADEDMATNAAALMVEYPAEGGNPYLVELKAEQVLEKGYSLVEGQMRLTLVKLLIEATEFVEKSKSFVAYEKLVVMQLVKIDNKLQYQVEYFREKLEGVNRTPTGKIEQIGESITPASTVGNKKEPYAILPIWFSGDGTKAMLLALTHMSEKHFAASADRRQLSMRKAKPITVLTYDAQGEEAASTRIKLEGLIEEGPYDMNFVLPGESKVTVVEFEGKNAQVLKADVDDLGKECQKLSVIHLTDQPVGNAESNAALKTRLTGHLGNLSLVAHDVEEMYENALSHMSKHFDVNGGKGTDIKITINRDFLTVEFDANRLTSLVNARTAGAATLNDIYNYLVSCDEINPTDTPFDKWASAVAADQIVLGNSLDDAGMEDE